MRRLPSGYRLPGDEHRMPRPVHPRWPHSTGSGARLPVTVLSLTLPAFARLGSVAALVRWRSRPASSPSGCFAAR
jgi:hypothetical protein